MRHSCCRGGARSAQTFASHEPSWRLMSSHSMVRAFEMAEASVAFPRLKGHVALQRAIPRTATCYAWSFGRCVQHLEPHRSYNRQACSLPFGLFQGALALVCVSSQLRLEQARAA